MLRIYTKTISPRLEYIVEFIFRDILKAEYEITTAKEGNIHLNYSDEAIDRTIHIEPHSLLFETGIRDQSVTAGQWNTHKTLFCTYGEIPFDILAASFYLVSRYEEYIPFKGDEHGRFPANKSIAFMNGFLQKPIVDIWAMELKKVILERYPDIKFGKTEYSFIPTFDIDIAYSYLGKGFIRNLGGAIKDLGKRIPILVGSKPDPYDTYEYIFKQLSDTKAIFFFLLGNRGKLDRNLSYKSKHLRQLIKRISEKYEVAIHPSYASNAQTSLVKTEKERLESILDKTVVKSRQHYLKMSFPKTYEILLESGIKEDYTMGFADTTGFRAGTSYPFFFYNIVKETTRSLVVYPLAIMDTTLNRYHSMEVEEAIDNVKNHIEEVKAVNGTFISLWHNQSLNNENPWQEWTKVFEATMESAKA